MDLDRAPVLLENRSRPKGNYLRVKAPVGARVMVEASAVSQIDEVRASGSYLSASEPIAHFGLGNAGSVDRVIVRFSNGKTKSLAGVKSNQTITVWQEIK
jgi:hypothetical protein